jgi:hypothetical protein
VKSWIRCAIAAAGGLVPWALIGGLGTDVQVGATAFVTYVSTLDFALRTEGVSVDEGLDFGTVPRAVGAARGEDVDLYIAATKPCG